jgi:hypothetical protein
MVCYNRFESLLDSKVRRIRKVSVELFKTPILQMSSCCRMPSHSRVSWPHCEMWKWNEQNSGKSNTCIGIFVLIMLRQHWVMSRSVRSTLQPAVIKYNVVTNPNRLKWTRTWKICRRSHWHNCGIWRNTLGGCKLLTCYTFFARCWILVTYRHSLLQFTTMHQH